MELYKFAKVCLLTMGILISVSVQADSYTSAIAISRCAGQMSMLAATLPDQSAAKALNERVNGWRVAAVMELILDGWGKDKAFTVVDSEKTTTETALLAKISVSLNGANDSEKRLRFEEFSNDIMMSFNACLIHNDRVEVLIRKMRESQK